MCGALRSHVSVATKALGYWSGMRSQPGAARDHQLRPGNPCRRMIQSPRYQFLCRERSASVFTSIWYTTYMKKLLEQAIEQLRDLPEDDQDAAADVLFAYISSDER